MSKPITIKIRGGHRIDREADGSVHVTDNSGEKWQVDTSCDITCDSDSIDIPLVGGFSTPASPEEAFVMAELTKQIIVAGARRFKVAQHFGERS